MATLTAPALLCKERRTFQKDNKSLQHSTNQACMVEWPDGSHYSAKGTWQPVWSLPKGTWRTLGPWETKFSGLMKQRLKYLAWMPNIMSEGNQALLISWPPSLQWSMVVAASCCGDVFQRLELIIIIIIINFISRRLSKALKVALHTRIQQHILFKSKAQK